MADMTYNQGVESSRIAAIVAETIETACRQRKWSYSDLAEEIGVAESTIHKWRAGPQDNYKVQALIKLFELAGASMDRLFELDPDAESVDELRRRAERAEWMLDQLRESTDVAEPADEEEPVLGLESDKHFQAGVSTARARRRLRKDIGDEAERLAEQRDSEEDTTERTG